MKNSIMIILLACGTNSIAQVKTVSLDSALNIAYSNNKHLQSVSMQSDYYQLQKKTSSELPKTDISLTYGQYNAYYKKDNNLTVSQTIPFPTVFGAKSSLADALVAGAEMKTAAAKNELTYQIRQVYYQLLFWNKYRELVLMQDSMYTQFSKSAEIRYLAGDATLLEKTSANSRLTESRNKLRQVDAQIHVFNINLQSLMGVNYSVSIDMRDSLVGPFNFVNNSAAINSNPQLAYIKQQTDIAQKEQSVIKSTALPEFRAGYFNQTLYGVPLDATNTRLAGSGNRFQGVLFGIAIPLWFAPQSNKNKMAQTLVQINQLAYEGEQIMFQGQYDQAVQQYLSAKLNLEYYQMTALTNADLIEKQAQIAYAKGEIGFSDYLLSMQQVISIRENYAAAVSDYNQAVIYMEYLIGK